MPTLICIKETTACTKCTLTQSPQSSNYVTSFDLRYDKICVNLMLIFWIIFYNKMHNSH